MCLMLWSFCGCVWGGGEGGICCSSASDEDVQYVFGCMWNFSWDFSLEHRNHLESYVCIFCLFLVVIWARFEGRWGDVTTSILYRRGIDFVDIADLCELIDVCCFSIGL